jgi:hypothetical protein
MEVIIKGEAKEIAALLLEIEGRRNKEVDVDKIFQSLSYGMSKGGEAMERDAATEGANALRDMSVRIRVEDVLLKGRLGEVKEFIAGIEKEYGGNHTLSIPLEVRL